MSLLPELIGIFMDLCLSNGLLSNEVPHVLQAEEEYAFIHRRALQGILPNMQASHVTDDELYASIANVSSHANRRYRLLPQTPLGKSQRNRRHE